MRSFVYLAAMATAASLAAASPSPHPLFEYPDTVPLEKRQEAGTPQYACHEDCGLLITLGRAEGYCSNAEWNERYGRCMICANTYDVWRYYGGSVTTLAGRCGLSPTPSPSGFGLGGASSTVAPPPAAVTTTTAPVTNPPTTLATTTSRSGSASVSGPASQSTTAGTSTGTRSSTSVGTIGVTPTTTQRPLVNGASKNFGLGSALGAAALAIIAAH